MNHQPIPFACDMSVFSDVQREHHIQVVHQLFDQKQAVQELPDGYAWQFADDPTLTLLIAKFVSQEHRCCPFFRFTLEVEPGHEPIWLRITGAEGVKNFARAELPNWVTS